MVVNNMFDVFNNLHDSRLSNSVPHYSFYDLQGDLIKGDTVSVDILADGQFGTLTVTADGDTTQYAPAEYTVLTECLYVLGIGYLLPGDIVKLKIDAIAEYELGYGWHTNVSGQNIYSWYLVPRHVDDLFAGSRQGLFNNRDVDITKTGILTVYREYLDTIEVVEFRKDRITFDVI
jgi:hypothetical protein